MKQHFLFFLIFSTTANSQRVLNFKLEHYNTSCGGLNTLAAIDKSTTININHNVVHIEGFGNLTREIRGSVELHMKVSKCRDGKCEDPGVTVVPNCCPYFERMPFLSHGMGDFFEPKIRCPIKRGVYTANITYDLAAFAVLPIESKFTWRARIMPYQIKGAEKKLIACVEGVIRIQAFGSRRGQPKN